MGSHRGLATGRKKAYLRLYHVKEVYAGQGGGGKREEAFGKRGAPLTSLEVGEDSSLKEGL